MKFEWIEKKENWGEGIIDAPEYGFKATLQGHSSDVFPLLEILGDQLEHQNRQSAKMGKDTLKGMIVKLTA